MELAKLILHWLVVVLLIGLISCEDATEAPPADATGDTGEAAATGAPTQPAAAVGDTQVVTEDARSVAVVDPCDPVSDAVEICNANLDEGDASCEKINEYDTCVQKAQEGCSEESVLTETKTVTDGKKAEKTNGLNCDTTTSAPQSNDGSPAVTTGSPDDTAVPASSSNDTGSESAGNSDSQKSTSTQSVSQQVATLQPSEEELTSKVDDLSVPAEGSSTVKSTQTSAPAGKVTDEKAQVTVEAAEPKVPTKATTTTVATTTLPATTEPPIPECEDPIGKAAEVQKCNDVIKQDSLCIQIQKAVDCVEQRVDCSEEKFDKEIDKYLDSFENYANDNECIITYQGKRLQHRRRPEQAALSQSHSGSASISLFSSLALIVISLALSR